MRRGSFIKRLEATVVACCAVFALTAPAQAASLDYDGTYAATSVNTAGNDHTFWLNGLIDGGADNYWQFDGGSGVFTVAGDNATANLTGTIRNNVHATFALIVDVTFALRGLGDEGDIIPNNGTLEYKGSSHGGDPSMWAFYDMTTASLTGADDLAGLLLSLTTFGPPAQLGDGANDKNAGLGAAQWFSWTVEENTTKYAFESSTGRQHGDINLNLSPVPVPAAGLLLIGAIGSLGFARRKA